MALSGGFPTTHCCCVDGSSSSKRNKVRNIFYSILARKREDGISNESTVSID